MRKIYLFMLMAVGLLISGNAFGDETVYTISSQDNAQSQVEAWLVDEGDATLVVGDNVSVSFATAQNISAGIKTIDLNGHELTWTNTWAEADKKENQVVVATAQYVINITTGTLKIKDRASGGQLSMVGSRDNGYVYGIYMNDAGGKFVMESGQLSYTTAATSSYRVTPLCVYGKGTVNISGGSIEMKNNNSFGAYLSGTIEQLTNFDVHCIEGYASSASTVEGLYVSCQNDATLAMDNCFFDLSRVAETIKTNALEFAKPASSMTPEVTIKNSTLIANNHSSTRRSVYNNNNNGSHIVHIESGNFVGDVYNITSISGGTFSTLVPEKMLASGYVCVPQGDKFIVRLATDAEKVIELAYTKDASTTTEYYASLYQAWTAAETALGSKATDYKITIKSDYSYTSWPSIYGKLIVPVNVELTGDATAKIYGDVENHGTINCPLSAGANTGDSKITHYNHEGAVLSVKGYTANTNSTLINDGTLNIGGSASIETASANQDGTKKAEAGKIINNGTINIAANAMITVKKKSTTGYVAKCDECENAYFENNGIVLGTDNTSKLVLSAPATGTEIGSSYGQIPAEANTYAWVSATNSWDIAGKVINVTTHTGYESLASAISSANAGDELKIMEGGYQGGAIPIEKAVIIDLNGQNLEFNYTAVSDRGQAFTIQNGGILTIKDGAATAPASIDEDGNLVYDGGKITAAFGNGTILVRSGGVLNLQGGIIEQTSTTSQSMFAAIEMTEKSDRSIGAADAQVNISGGAVKAGQVGIMIYGTSSIASITEHAPQITISDGVIMGERGCAILGLGTQGFWDTKINIDGGYVYSKEAPAIYNPQYGQINISAGTVEGYLSGIEIRAGELTMTGGKIISTYEGSESESLGNGSGTTTVGAGIAVSQHGTKQPITIEITSGDIDAIIPVKLANPENNPETDINKVSVSIEGGRYKVTNNASAPFWSVTDKFYVSAGKFSHMPAYVVEGKTVVPNTDESDKAIYPWTIGVINDTPVNPDDKTDITWQTAEDWKNNQIPASVDKVEINANQNVVVSGSSEETAVAYEITIGEGATLTVQSGATLVVGGGGITNEGGQSNINGLKVEPGAQVIVSPDADMTGLYGRVALTPNVGKYSVEMSEYVSKPNRYQLVGIPTIGKPDAITKNKDDGDGFKLNQWDVMTGWKAANLNDFSVPFKGFFFWNDVDLTDKPSDLVTYYFKGELFGNKAETLTFTEHEGFHLFANSYLAEVDIMALIQGAENNVQKAVYVYDPVAEKFTDISYATYGKEGVPSAIQPMQGFYFLNQHDENTTAPMDYVSMVWSNAFKVEQEFVPGAPRRNAAIDGSEVRINITDNVVGRTDGVYVMESDQYSAELDGSDIQKMMNPETSVNIYATTPVGNLSTMQTNDIEYQYLTIETNAASMYTMSFDWVAGETLYLLDTYTNQTTLMTEGNTYTFVAQPKSVINDRFQIVRTGAQAPTTIKNVKNIKAVKGTYTVTGQCLGEKVDFDKLPQGVYVIDGVKVVK